MEKALVISNDVTASENCQNVLSGQFSVRSCKADPSLVDGMINLQTPDIVVVYLPGVAIEGILDLLLVNLPDTPVIGIGSRMDQNNKMEHTKFLNYEAYTAVVIDSSLLVMCCNKLNITPDPINLVKRKRRRTVLIIDDSPFYIRSINEMISEEFEVLAATNGVQGIATLESKEVDAVLLDYEMPQMDGVETLKRIKAIPKLKYLPVLFLTGVSDRNHIVDAIALKPSGYVLKTITKEQLIEKLNEIIID